MLHRNERTSTKQIFSLQLKIPVQLAESANSRKSANAIRGGNAFGIAVDRCGAFFIRSRACFLGNWAFGFWAWNARCGSRQPRPTHYASDQLSNLLKLRCRGSNLQSSIGLNVTPDGKAAATNRMKMMKKKKLNDVSVSQGHLAQCLTPCAMPYTFRRSRMAIPLGR